MSCRCSCKPRKCSGYKPPQENKCKTLDFTVRDFSSNQAGVLQAVPDIVGAYNGIPGAPLILGWDLQTTTALVTDNVYVQAQLPEDFIPGCDVCADIVFLLRPGAVPLTQSYVRFLIGIDNRGSGQTISTTFTATRESDNIAVTPDPLLIKTYKTRICFGPAALTQPGYLFINIQRIAPIGVMDYSLPIYISSMTLNYNCCDMCVY